MGETLCELFPIGYLFLDLYLVIHYMALEVLLVVVVVLVAVGSLLLLSLICTTINAYF